MNPLKEIRYLAVKAYLKSGLQLATIILIAIILFPLVLSFISYLDTGERFKINVKHIAQAYQARVTAINPNTRYVIIRIPDSLATGTDQACARAAHLFHKICSIDPEIKLEVFRLNPRYIYNPKSITPDSGEKYDEIHWIPSDLNPMTLEWTQKLIKDLK